MKMKTLQNNKLLLGILLVLVVVLFGSDVLQSTVQSGSGFTPIFCAEYEHICCSKHSSPTYITETNKYFIQCPPESECVLDSISGNYVDVFEFANCEMKQGLFGGYYADCSGKIKKVSTGDEIVSGRFVAYDNGVNILKFNSATLKIYSYKLFNCGPAPCSDPTTGTPISGTCEFAGDYDKVYDNYGRLINPNYEGLYTVPPGYCYLTTNYANRRICGYVEEQCSSNSDCASNYPYQYTEGNNIYGATCSNNMLTLYGCVQQPGSGECIFIDDKNNNGKMDNGEDCLEYNPISWCGAIAGKTIPVQCCPDSSNACGPNAVCNPSTFRCEETRVCSYDWQCEGAGTSCDYITKKLKTWGCLQSGTCGITKEEPVECCSDVNCPNGWFCDQTDHKCYENVKPKIQCDSECCVGDGVHIDKLCPYDKPYCCPDGKYGWCAEDINSCGTHPPINDEISLELIKNICIVLTILFTLIGVAEAKKNKLI